MAIGATDICEAAESSIAMQEASGVDEEEDPFAALDALSDAIDAMVVDDVQVSLVAGRVEGRVTVRALVVHRDVGVIWWPALPAIKH